jgi:hypothetical protein
MQYLKGKIMELKTNNNNKNNKYFFRSVNRMRKGCPAITLQRIRRVIFLRIPTVLSAGESLFVL